MPDRIKTEHLLQEIEALRTKVLSLEEEGRKPETDQVLVESRLEGSSVVTDQVDTEGAFRESEERFQLLVENIPTVFWTTDETGNTSFISSNVSRVYGFTADEIYAAGEKLWFGRIHPEDVSEVIRNYDSLFKDNRPFEVEYRILHKNGRYIWVHDQAVLIRDKGGKRFACGLFSDITERKRIQRTLQERELHYRTLFESANDAIFIMEGERFLECNPKTLQMFACAAEQIIGKTPQDFSPPFQPDGLDSTVKARRIIGEVENGVPQFFEWRHQRTDGEPFDAEVNLAPLRQEGQRRIIAIVRDVTRRKRGEEALNRALDEVRRMKEMTEAENVYLHREIRMAHLHGDIVGQSESMRSVMSLAEQVAVTDSTALILGETGTGKELLARAIHNMSSRKNRPLVTVNCAAIPMPLVESELFGREKGAYTGALDRQIGRFEIADGSTIFLDEIGELSMDIQAKLLRALQEGQIERLGSSRTIKVNVRVIAATNRDLEKEITENRFREDLYYRLNVFPIRIPPLRERKEDIPTLVWHFVDRLSERMGRRIEKITQQSIESLQGHNWPGNVRELHNVIERAMIQTTDSILRIPPFARIAKPPIAGGTLAEVEKLHIIDVLDQTGWRIRGRNGAAAILGLKPTTLESRMLKLNIKRSPHLKHDKS